MTQAAHSRRLPVGEVRNLLAGLCCPLLAGVRADDAQEARVETALKRSGRRAIYALVVKVDEPKAKKKKEGR